MFGMGCMVFHVSGRQSTAICSCWRLSERECSPKFWFKHYHRCLQICDHDQIIIQIDLWSLAHKFSLNFLSLFLFTITRLLVIMLTYLVPCLIFAEVTWHLSMPYEVKWQGKQTSTVLVFWSWKLFAGGATQTDDYH